MNECYWYPAASTSEGSNFKTECGQLHFVDNSDRQPSRCPFCSGAIKLVPTRHYIPVRQ